MDDRQKRESSLLLIVIADDRLRRELLEGLPNYGWRVITVAHPDEIPALLLQHQPDVLMIDPDFEPPEVILEAYGIPCVALLPEQEEQLAMRLMRERWVTMCVAPPFQLEWLAVSLSSLARLSRGEGSREGRWFYPRREESEEAWSLTVGTWTLTAPGGASVVLNQAETTFLATLADKAGQAVPRYDMIVALGHDTDYFDSRRLDTMVSRLRIKVNKISPVTLPVRSIHAVGYAFVAPIRVEKRASG